MRFAKQLFPLFLVLLLTFAFVLAAKAETETYAAADPADQTPAETPGSAEPSPVTLPYGGDYTVRINGGYVSEHMETVNDKDCLRVDLFLGGVTSERLLSSISFKLLYDPDQLTFEKSKSFSGGGVMGFTNTNVPGLIQTALASTNGSLINDSTPLLTLWFTVAEDLPAGTQIRFAFSEPIKADSLPTGSYNSEKRTVGARLKPFGIAPIFGDANCDCEVTAADAALVLRMITGLNTLSDTGLKNAKVCGKAALSAEDAALILRYVVKLIDRFPAEG